ncbi:EF-hand calcium-binding domain-containing protein 7-like isoform X3 [Mytilus californianus]|uniref:EF-hand calcium-binding domain-containing protein 7-like isoform X3 n=1 Tax=Mytilus californianus TaxID=6549 RepID=UPI002247951D|nr:EF-hand calcium-binding domain-containing protein 7-like isoform X3 [Mytilus californianus]
MSRRSSRSSTMDQGEFILECKAAYLSMFDSIKEKIESQDSLLEALQQTGRNPSVKVLKKYWTNDTDELSFDDFVDICRKEPVTTSDDLMKAFRKIDINGDGYISLEELHKILTSKGEKKSKSEVKTMIDEVDENRDGRLDYKEFCKMVMSTTEESKKMQRKMMERKEKKKKQEIERRGDVSGSQVSVRSTASSVKNQEKSASQANIESGNRKKEANKENKDDDDDDEIDEECVTARSGSARSERPKPSPRKSMSETTTSQAKDVSPLRTSFKEKTEDISGSRTSLQSKDDVLLTSRRSSRSQTKDSSRSKKEKDREGLCSSRLSNSPDKLMGSNSTLQNVPDVIGSNVSLTSASGLMAKNLRQNGEGSPPIPAQRKSLLHTASSSDPDDLPRPSPRVKKDKSRQSSVSRSHKLDEPKNLREWTHTKSKGSFFMEDGSLICHQYDFNLPDDSKIWITMQPQKASRGMDSNPVDTSVFILRDRPDEDGNLLVAFTEHRDGRGKYGVSCDLSAGKYYIMPYTTGCRFKSRKSESEKEAKLVSQDKGGKYVITKAFRKVLEDIFDYSDLDGNGFMSRKEFNLFNIRTSGEEVADEEWQVVEDRIDLEDGEITKAGFLQLNELEAEDSEGDTEDLWTTLVSMGYNKQLIMDQACPFQLDVYTEDCDDAELDVVRVDSYPTYPGDLSFDDIISKSFIKHGEISRVKGMKDLCMYTYKNDGWASLVLDNKSHTRVRVELDCSRSENVISNHDSLQRTLRVDPGSTLIAYHLMPEDEDRDWQVKCTETIR